MSRPFELVVARAPKEEGRVPYAYNDKTGKRVTCQTNDPETSGNLSIGQGINLEVGLDQEEMQWLFEHRLAKAEQAMLRLEWYAQANDEPVRQSVALDAGFNLGVDKLAHHFPNFVAAFGRRDWETAEKELAVKEDNVDKQRYAPLRALIRAGGK